MGGGHPVESIKPDGEQEAAEGWGLGVCEMEARFQKWYSGGNLWTRCRIPLPGAFTV